MSPTRSPSAGSSPESSPNDGPRRPGPESKLDDTREQLVEAAAASLLTRGVEIGLGQITLSAAIEATGISRASAYRSLADDDLDPQEFLRREVIVRVLNRDSRGATHRAIADAVAEVLEAEATALESADVGERTRAVRSLIRAGGAASYHAVAASTERAILIAAYGALSSQAEHAPQWQKSALADGEREIARLFSELYSGLSLLVGYELRSEYTLSQFATAAAGLVEGISMRAGVSNDTDGLVRPTGRGGAPEEWTLFAVAFEGLYCQFFRPASPDEPFADLVNH